MSHFRFRAAGLLVGCLVSFFTLTPLQAADPEILPVDANGSANPEPAQIKPAEPAAPQRKIGSLAWHTSYSQAYREAQEQRKMLLIYFRDEAQPVYHDNFERSVLADPLVAPELDRVVRVVVSAATTENGRRLSSGGRERLLDHPSFGFMYRTPGLAMVDLASVGWGTYRKVASAHPFLPHRSENSGTLRVLLTLPPGTITQRALIYAMRLHPSQPQGANYGSFSGYLGSLANHHSWLMTSQGVGHHDWGTRAGQVTASTGRSPSEVAAMTGNRYLLDAAFELVTQWRNSPSHWVLLSPPASVYALDMVHAPNGTWFGTGIFAR